MAKAKAPYVTTKELRLWLQRERERLSAQRKASDLAKLQAPLEEKVQAYVEANGGEKRACLHSSGFRLAIEKKAGSVKWKEEFLRLAGQKEAERLVSEAPQKDVLIIEPPAEAAA